MDLAARRGASVLNLSVAGEDDRVLGHVLAGTIAAGRTVVAAVGHRGTAAPPPFPARMEGVVAVTAVDAVAQAYPLATRGAFVDLAAPGVEILSTAPGNQLAFFAGTSAAAAFVSATAALLLQDRAQPGGPARRARLEATARDLGPPGKDPHSGSGLLDACRALARDAAGERACGER